LGTVASGVAGGSITFDGEEDGDALAAGLDVADAEGLDEPTPDKK
jgi:hypothetical protein